MKLDKVIWDQENLYLKMVMEQIEIMIESSQDKVIDQRSALKEINKNMLSEFKFETESMVDLEGAAIMHHYQTMGRNVENAMDYQIQRTRELVKLKENAYFAKINFREKGEDEEEIYIGSSSLIKEGQYNYLIYDWRAPICSIFYDYEAGDVSYKSPGGDIYGKLQGKRHFKILEGKIVYMFDSNINIMDDMLKEALAKSVDDKMKTIITTIQKEQNQVIRDESSDILVVSGSAGSGKTSIALHRIAYLLYRNRQTIIPADILIFTPNDIFSDYISHVLPELGEKNIDSITFNDYLESILGIHLSNKEESLPMLADNNNGHVTEQEVIDKAPGYYDNQEGDEEPTERIDPIEEKTLKCRWEEIESYYDQMEYILSSNHDVAYQERVKLIVQKASLQFFQRFDVFIDEIEKKADFFEDVYFQGHCILSKEEMKESYLDCVGIIKCSSRLLQTRNRVMERMNEIKKAAAYSYEQQLINGEDYYTRSDLRRKTIKFVKQAFRPIRKLIIQMTSLDLLDLYNDFLISQQLPPVSVNLKFEDALCLMYMKGRLDTIKEVNKVKYLVIDEAQDYSLLHYKIIKLIFGHCKYTLLGDPNQAIHPYVSSHVSGDIEDFLGETPKHIRLTKTYRSTQEINSFCRTILASGDSGENVLRNGREPEVIELTAENQSERLLSIVSEAYSRGNRSIAIIGKTKKQCEALYLSLVNTLNKEQRMLDNAPMTLGLLNNEELLYKTGIIVMPSYLAKGLEFDCVIVAADQSNSYHIEEERRLFYTVCTRALHELHVTYQGEFPKLLAD
jgi:DNA helicase II / ATP-dependent DNA helicase PcrA